ncbi:MAG: hypothetical protein ABEJ87_00135 [Candidatus Nanohalobium sp.]
MKSEEILINVTDEEFGFSDEGLTFRYTEKEDGNQKVERYQVFDDLGILYSGEKVWRTEETGGLFGFFIREEEVYEESVQKRVAYDSSRQSVITEEASWDEFRGFLSGTDAERYISGDTD